jgi:hypothetical protein
VRPEADRRGRGDTGKSTPARGVPDDEEKQEEPQERELRIGPRLRRVEKEERSGGREPEKTPTGSPRWKRPGAGAERREREEGQDPCRPVREGERLREPDERLLEEVEKRRPGVRAQDANELGRREPGDPDREDLVVPQRARDEQPQATGDGESGGGKGSPEREAARFFSLSFDDLS